MEFIRYGLIHLILVGTIAAASGLALLHLTGLPWSAFFVGGVVVVTVGVLALDILFTPLRVFRDFRAGRFRSSARGTRFLLHLTWRPAKKAALRLNQAACHLALGDYETGGAMLQKVDKTVLSGELRSVWDNNYAYFLLGVENDPKEALKICDNALASTASNPAFHGTRGLALLTLGRLDDAIAELCRSMEIGSLGPAGLAETYFYLGRAWEQKGERAYARDHFLKAVNVAPQSPFGQRAAQELNRFL